MKNFASVIALALALPALFAAHGADAQLKVFACEPEWAALAQELGGTAVEVYAATTAQQDPHQIQPRPSLIARFRRAELAVCTGAELESGWLPMLAQAAANPRLQPGRPGYFEAASVVDLLEVPASLDRSQGDVHPSGNPHILTDPRNIAPIAQALALRLSELDPAQAPQYRARAADFGQRWQAALARWRQSAEPLRGLRVFTYHREFSYLFNWLGIELAGTLEPKPGLPPSAGHLETLLALQQRQPARMILRSAYQDPRAAQWLSQRTGIPAVLLPYTVGGTPAAGDLFALYDDSIQRLLDARAGQTAP